MIHPVRRIAPEYRPIQVAGFNGNTPRQWYIYPKRIAPLLESAVRTGNVGLKREEGLGGDDDGDFGATKRKRCLEHFAQSLRSSAAILQESLFKPRSRRDAHRA